jgi:hypothetical protein
MSTNSNGNGEASLPEPAPLGQASRNNSGVAVAHPSAMTLFAPDPNTDPESVSFHDDDVFIYYVSRLLNLQFISCHCFLCDHLSNIWFDLPSIIVSCKTHLI